MAAEQKSFPEDVLDPALVGNDAEMEDTKAESPPARKRKRSLKLNVDKKFECKHEGCGKSYSRAEHLYRHQLNRELSILFSQTGFLTESRYSQNYLPLRLPGL